MPQKPRVLVVDDEERFRATLARMLALQGLEVLALGSGREALTALAAEPYDVVVLDLRMPDLDGLHTLKEIKNLRPATEVIILTGHANLDAAMEIIKLGGYDYLLKPCPVEDLMLKIDAAFERKREREKSRK
ncbi:MAG: response regulator [Deltaproteobacteria bacterium]|nr:response regulator [Deltaproteobacteria bacterium]